GRPSAPSGFPIRTTPCGRWASWTCREDRCERRRDGMPPPAAHVRSLCSPPMLLRRTRGLRPCSRCRAAAIERSRSRRRWVSSVLIRRACAGLRGSRIAFRFRLRARLDAGALLIEEPDRSAPGIAREPLVAHGQLLADADARLEQIDRGGLLAGVHLE